MQKLKGCPPIDARYGMVLISFLAFVCLTGCRSVPKRGEADIVFKVSGQPLRIEHRGTISRGNWALSPDNPWVIFKDSRTIPATLSLYNIYTRQWAPSFSVNLFPKQFERHFFVQSKDSIFILLNSVPRPHRSVDSTLVLINSQGQLLNHYVPYSLDVPHNGRPIESMDSTVFPTASMYDSFHLCGNRLYFNVTHSTCWPCKGGCSPKHNRLAAYIDLGSGHNQLLPLTYPEHVPGHCWPHEQNTPYLLSNRKGQLVAAWGMHPTYQILDTATNRVTTTCRLPWSRFVDTIRAYPKGPDGRPLRNDQFDPVEGEYVYFDYDPYLRWIRLPKHGRRPMIELNRDRFALAVYDSNFQLLGEGLLPEACQPDERTGRWLKWLLTPEGYWFRNTALSDSVTDVYDPYVLEFGKVGRSVRPPQHRAADSLRIYEEDWGRYLREVHGIAPHDEVWFVVQSHRGCPICRIRTLGHFAQLYDSRTHTEPALRLLLVGERMQEVDSLIGNRPLYLESKKRHHYYVRETGNPRMLLFRRGKLYRNYELNPADVSQVPALYERFRKGEELPRPEEL